MRTNQLFIEFKTELLKIKDKKKFEKSYYEKLRKCLKAGQFKTFKLLFNTSVEFNVFFDIKKIPDRFNIISKLLLNCIDRVANGYQISALGEIIKILKFCAKYNLLEKGISILEKKNLRNLKKDTLFLANLNDLFGKVSDSFILYIYNVMPRDLYNYFIKSPISLFPNRDELAYYIKNVFFDEYTIYGLIIRNLGTIAEFIKKFKENYPYSEEQLKKEELLNSKEKGFIEFDMTHDYSMFYHYSEEEHKQYVIKKHFVSPKGIIKNLNKILMEKNYNFYSLSMVLLGGLGPQGLGFTYSTPRGEVIEICSDQRESMAIIIKYKQYLKRKFLNELEKELDNFRIDELVKTRILRHLSGILNQNELINYYKKEPILKRVKSFLEQIDEIQYNHKSEFHDLISKISAAISIILRRIQLKDQFITRMNLVIENKIKSEDIAKLTSLKGKSHYDVLRERFFFQYIVDWFYEIYVNERLKKEKGDAI
ncbi:MAG: hypothetical protein ACFE91_06225 [Promethearchaeota archaeon]